MRDWICNEYSLQPRPVIFVEDRLTHVLELCNALARSETVEGEVLQRCTMVVLDEAGYDTEHQVVQMLLKYPALQVVAQPFKTPLRPCLAALDAGRESTCGRTFSADIQTRLSAHREARSPSLSSRFLDLPKHSIQDEPALGRLLDQLIRPGGLVVCDIQLRTLPFTSDSIPALYYGVRAASIACRRQAEQSVECIQDAAQLLVVSSIATYGPRMDRELAEHGVLVGRDDIYRKSVDRVDIVNRIRSTLRERFPWQLHMRHPHDGSLVAHYVGRRDKAIIDSVLDLGMWPAQDKIHQISGQAVLHGKSVPEYSGRAEVLQMLIRAQLKPKGGTVDYADIIDTLRKLKEKQSPAQVIEGILRLLHPDHQRRLIPRGTDSTYRISNEARVGNILER
jgi:hypothetical protein